MNLGADVMLNSAHMDWLEKRATEARDLASREAMIVASASEVYELLWKELLPIIAEANNRKLAPIGSITTNGTPASRIIKMPTIATSKSASSSSPKIIRIDLASDKHSIAVNGLGQELKFELSVCDDGCHSCGAYPFCHKRLGHL